MNVELSEKELDFIIERLASEEIDYRGSFNHPNYFSHRDQEAEDNYERLLTLIMKLSDYNNRPLHHLTEWSYHRLTQMIFKHDH